jgi:NAD(P)H-hydrate epimerase
MGTRGVERGAFVLSRDGAREVDRLAHEEFGLPTIVLMENAARGLAGVVLDELRRVGGGGVLVVCGRGNNGGDGYAAARHLANAGVEVACVAEVGEEGLRGDALVNARVARAMGIRIGAELPRGRWRVVVDAILGTGLRGGASGRAAELIGEVNGLGDGGVRVVSADVPSGMDCETGLAGGAVVRADVTVTFAGLKVGMMELGAQALTGEIVVVDIGVPRVVLERVGRWVAGLERGGWVDGGSGGGGGEESGGGRRFGGGGR